MVARRLYDARSGHLELQIAFLLLAVIKATSKVNKGAGESFSSRTYELGVNLYKCIKLVVYHYLLKRSRIIYQIQNQGNYSIKL